MTYEEAMEFIRYTNKLGSVPGLEAITDLLERLANPQDRLRIIHVAGTNGKGSTISFLSSVLAAAGYRVGIYISPTVFSYREKLQIISRDVNEYISKEYVSKAISMIKTRCDEMVSEGKAHPTSFEIETAMAFLYMLWKKVDFLILETGMGGRLDATNVIESPVCCVFTPVSLDHMQYLGNTLEEIAYEKAGIMKQGSYVLSSNQRPEVLKVFNRRAEELGIQIMIADSSVAKNIIYSDEYTSFEYPGNDRLDVDRDVNRDVNRNVNGDVNRDINLDIERDKYRIRLLGKYQVQNAVLAIEAARGMASLGYMISDKAIREGLWNAKWHGRLERVSKSPDIFIDGAHNEEAALSLQESIQIYFTNHRLIFMIGVLADKDYRSMLRILAPMADAIITLTPDNPRALSSEILASEARAYCSKVCDEKDIEHAINRAFMEAEQDDIILAFGSLSFLGSLVSDLKARKDENNDG
ncbi:MAG: bifunctional folylpolyglutamate synthase/dihydrofolate synthase [Clostridiales bacterium]|jgi:dihydrofolate synthase/folylpolyglutamate synthase|nr:bifunctional folylpolyglutamate synthase/dihydrofolate synthase [Clostridiales bacterium]